MDGTSSLKGIRKGIVLEGPSEVLLEQSLCFNFHTNNNQVEYETLLAGMKFAREVGDAYLQAKSDSQLVTN